MDGAGETFRVLVVDDSGDIRQMCSALAEREGFVSITAADGAEALSHVERENPEIVLLDLRLPDTDGLDLLRRIKAHNETTAVILMTAYAAVDTAVEAMKSGAQDYLVKPLQISDLRRCLHLAARTANLHSENRRLRQFVADHFGLSTIVGQSPAMQIVYDLLRRISPSEVNCLIVGEPGTGKEKIARALHLASHRSRGPFVVANCGAIPGMLIDSELFGHFHGAFTGASTARKGYVLSADRGTLFLDDVGELPLETQQRMLRVIEKQEVMPVGADRAVPVGVRVVAAANEDLGARVSRGTFSEDLFYRLNVVQIELPPLRERREDIPLLVQHFFQELDVPHQISDRALQTLMHHDWPGNVRELYNTVRRACALANEPVIRREDLPEPLRQGEAGVAPTEDASSLQSLAELERDAIVHTLRERKGDRTSTARVLGIDRSTLYRKMKRYEITDTDWQPRPQSIARRQPEFRY